MAPIDNSISALLDEATSVLETFLISRADDKSLPRGWTGDIYGRLSKTITVSTDEFTVSICHGNQYAERSDASDYGTESSDNEDFVDDRYVPDSRGVHFEFSRRDLMDYENFDQPTEGIAVTISDIGIVEVVEDMTLTDYDNCAYLINRSKLAPLLREGAHLIPFRW